MCLCRAVLAVFVLLLAVCFTSGLLLSGILLLMVLPVLLACVRAVITRAVSGGNDMTSVWIQSSGTGNIVTVAITCGLSALSVC